MDTSNLLYTDVVSVAHCSNGSLNYLRITFKKPVNLSVASLDGHSPLSISIAPDVSMMYALLYSNLLPGHARK